METSRLRAFLAAAELGSLTAAAEKLSYTPSGVSQLITALEDDLGLTLLERSKKGVRLTESGEILMPCVRSFLQNEDALYETASNILGLSVGSVSVAAYPSIAAYWLPEIISGFQKKYPRIRVRIMEGIRQEMEDWIRTGDADMGFMTCSGSEDLSWTPIRDDDMVAVLPKDHPLSRGLAYPVNRLESEDFIMPALGHDVDTDKLLEDLNVTPRIRFTTMENPVAFSMISHGLGMTVCNKLCTELWSGRTAILPLDPQYKTTYGIETLKSRHLGPAAREFMSYALEKLKI